MGYTQEFKSQVVKKVLTGRKVQEISRETGVTDWTIYRWIKKYEHGTLDKETTGPRGLTLSDKQKLLLESQTLTEDNLGEWLRKKGLHSEHLNKWKDEITDAMDNNSKEKIEIKKLKEENQFLKKELERKDKALAEAAILITLKKKYNSLWEDEEK